MVPEAPLTRTEAGLVPGGDGWFVLNARDAPWYHADGRTAVCDFEGETPFGQLGVNISHIAPGEAMAMYHREADQEDFLVLSGEALLVVEEVERPLRQWDFVHCPPDTAHVIVNAGEAPCVVLAIGARIDSTGEDWGEYPPSPAAARHGTSVAERTTDAPTAYAGLPRRRPTAARPDWLP